MIDFYKTKALEATRFNMAATFQFCEDNGASLGGTFARGTSRSTGVSNLNWKSVDDTATIFSNAPLTAGQNSYDKFQFGVFTGSWNTVKSGLWQHTYNTNAEALGLGLVIKCAVSGSGFYRTPAQTANSLLIHNLSSTGLIATGLTVGLGINGPEHSGKTRGSEGTTGYFVSPWGVVAYTDYIATQLETSVSASAGNTCTTQWTFSWTEN